MPSPTFTSWLFPGQGSQYLGMGRELWSQPGPAMDIVMEAERLSGFPLRQISWLGPEEELKRTDVLQPALTALTLGCARLLIDGGSSPDMTSGHSLGEFAALHAAGVFSVTDCLRLVTVRGRLMQNIACRLNGGMAAVKRLSLSMLRELINRVAPEVCVANHNSSDQVVVSGSSHALGLLAPEITRSGGEFLALPVAGSWHHPSMEDAAQEFRTLIDTTPFGTPRCPIYMNVSGAAEVDPVRIKELVRLQMTSPVLWQSGIEAMFASGATLFLEVGPGKVLRGLMRRIIADESRYRVRGIENSRSLQFLTSDGVRPC